MAFLKSWIFSKKEANLEESDHESEIDEESDSSGSIEITDYIFGKPLYSEVIFEDMTHEKYHISASKLINNIEQWEYNRLIDAKHVEKLVYVLETSKHPHFIGSIKLAFIGENSIKLLDGGHRCAAICEMIKKDNNFDMHLDVDVYKLSAIDVNIDFDLVDLFVKANTNKPVQELDIPDNKIVTIINLMIQKWPKNIKTDETKGAYRPNITKKMLYQNLKNISNDFGMKNKTSEEIFERICILNDKFSTMSLFKLFGRNKISQQKLSAYEKAKKYGFFLNLDCQYSIDVWVLLINKASTI